MYIPEQQRSILQPQGVAASDGRKVKSRIKTNRYVLIMLQDISVISVLSLA